MAIKADKGIASETVFGITRLEIISICSKVYSDKYRDSGEDYKYVLSNNY